MDYSSGSTGRLFPHGQLTVHPETFYRTLLNLRLSRGEYVRTGKQVQSSADVHFRHGRGWPSVVLAGKVPLLPISSRDAAERPGEGTRENADKTSHPGLGDYQLTPSRLCLPRPVQAFFLPAYRAGVSVPPTAPALAPISDAHSVLP